MSIATEITRLQEAKTDLKTSINAKTDEQHQITTETIDDYADFVDSISSGGDEEINKLISYLDGTATKIDDNKITRLADQVFRSRTFNNGVKMTALTECLGSSFQSVGTPYYNLPNLVTCGSSCFYDIRTTEQLFLPKAESITTSFAQVSALIHVWLPKIKTANGNNMFYNCTSLLTLELGRNYTSQIVTRFLQSSTNFKTLILRKQSVVDLNNTTNTLNRTKIDAGTGYVYVPDILVQSYKTATNWTTWANQIVGINEEIELEVGQTFTPTAYSSDVSSWEVEQLQVETVASINTSTLAIATTGKGRVLVKGLNSDGKPVYVAHLTIGGGIPDFE